MKIFFLNILAVVSGIILGSMVNMGLIMVSGSIIPPPDGADVTTMEGLTASLHLFQPRHFLFPFLAHALGTLSGAFLTSLFVTSHRINFALVIGVFFLAGGVANIVMLPSPLWFSIVDLAGAYLPMAYLGGLMALKVKTRSDHSKKAFI